MTVINLTHAPMLSHLVGLLSYGKQAELTAADLDLPHPDNVPAWDVLGTEVISSVCATLEVKLTPAITQALGQTFRANAHKSEKHREAMNKITQALDFSVLTPEDDFPEYKASDVKRALTKANGLVDKIVEANGSLVLIYLCYLAGSDTTDELLYAFVAAQLDDEDSLYRLDHILTGCNAVNTEYKKWDRALTKAAKNYDFVELTLED